jgi:hypothetical protein
VSVTIDTDLVARAGESFRVPVKLDIAQGLTSAQFELAFDPTLLRLDNVLRGDLTKGFEVLTALTSPGRVLVTMSGAALGEASGNIAELVFTALEEGISTLDLQSVWLNGGNQALAVQPVVGADGTDGQVDIGAAVVAPVTAGDPGLVDVEGMATAPLFGAPAIGTPKTVAMDLGLSYWTVGNTPPAIPTSLPASTQADNWVKGFVSNLAKPVVASPNASISISLL